MLTELALVPATLVFYESPKRISRFLIELSDALGASRDAAVCRELTKRFEEVTRGSLGDLAEKFSGLTVKGEIVVLVGRAAPLRADQESVDEALATALQSMSVKDAASEVAVRFGLPRREIYQSALKLARAEGDE